MPRYELLLQVAPAALTRSDITTRLLSVVALIVLNAFFVTVEFSIVSVRRSRINQLVSAGDRQARTVQRLQRQLSSLLSTTQLGITLSSLALGWIGEHTMAELIKHWFQLLPVSAETALFLSHSISLPIAFLLLAYFQIVLGELCPKSIALIYPEKIARLLGPPSLTIANLLSPFVWLLNQSTRVLLALAGIEEAAPGHHGRVTPEELRLLITTATEIPDLEKAEREILSNVFEFRGTTVEEVMIPRTNIAAISQEASFQELLEEIVRSGHSRYPVMGESLDNILGILNFNDLAVPLSQGDITPTTPVVSWLRPARVVPKTLPLSELLAQMQQSAREMVVVMDEYGGTAGLVTFRDLTSEILGDVSNTSPDAQIVQKDANTVILPAQIDLEDANERLGLALPTSDDYLTLGGFMIFELQKIPQVNEQLIYQDLELTVIAATGPKLGKIQIHSPLQTLKITNAFTPVAVRKATDKPKPRQKKSKQQYQKHS